jgi:aryl-alcohol dehydrogenase-like predicted oxidoreductase
MLTRPLGPGAPRVSAIGFGGMPLSTHGRPSEAESIDVIHRVLDAGVTLIDTADVYCLQGSEIGHNERLIAKALRTRSGSSNGVILATKGGLTRPGGPGSPLGHDARPDALRAACERSLRALQVERIDLYQLHAPDARVPLADSVGALADLQRAGKIRWVGLSNVSVAEIRAAQAIVTVVTVQNQLNPLARASLERGVVRYCAEQGIGFLAYRPVGGRSHGLLVAGLPVLRRVAQRLGVTPQAVALAWLLAQAPCVIPIPGARRAEHALDSIGAAALTLGPEDLAAIGRARSPLMGIYSTVRSTLSGVPGLRAAYQWMRNRLG